MEMGQLIKIYLQMIIDEIVNIMVIFIMIKRMSNKCCQEE